MIDTIILIRKLRGLLNPKHHDLQVALSLFEEFNQLFIKSNNQSVTLNIETKNLEVKVSINDFEIDASYSKQNLFQEVTYNQKNLPENFISSCM